MDEEELYRLMNEEDELYMGDSEEETASSKEKNNTGCFGILLAGIFIVSSFFAFLAYYQ